MATDDLDQIAAELYVLPPEEFTASRNARARDAGPLATAIKALRKPVVAAWAVNILVRAGGLDDALELATALREAQDDMDAAELKRLGAQRRQLVAALASQAVARAGERGVTVSAATREDIAATLNAAMIDAGAAAAVSSGRLVRPLEATGFGDVDLDGAVGGSATAPAARPHRDDLAERRARKAAEKAAREADRAAAEAERALARIDARRDKAQERVDHLRERIDDLRREIERFEADAATAESDLDSIEREHKIAADAAAAASATARAARAALG